MLAFLKSNLIYPNWYANHYQDFSILKLNYQFCFSTLGGEDFDQKIMDYFIKMYKKKKGKDIRKDNRAVQKLRREVEKAKRALSTQHQARIEIESFFDGEDFSETLTRARFENENMVGIFFYSFT